MQNLRTNLNYKETKNLLIAPNSLILDLAYATHIELILWSNLNYKKLLKYVDYSNFLHTNLNYKKDKNVPIVPTYLFMN